jgi:hypothetical protein
MFSNRVQTTWMVLAIVATIGMLLTTTPMRGAAGHFLAMPSGQPFSPTSINPKIVASFPSPGGQVKALAWGNNSLWLADKNYMVYRLDANGTVLGTFTTTVDISDLSWYEDSLWAHDGAKVYQLDSNGQISSTLNVGYWWNSGMEWAEGYLYVNDYNSGTVYKHNPSGNQLLSWDVTFLGHPENMAYDGIGLWIADSCEGGNGLWRYSLQGVLQDMINLNSVEPCDYTSERAVAWDGQYLWYAGKFTVYRLDITGLFVDANVGLTGVSNSSSAWGDYNGDGKLDIIVTGSAGSTPTTKIYRNNGNNVFTDIHATVPNVYKGSVDWGDYNNDGKLDILLTGCADVTCSTRVTRVYRNNGNGTFSNVVTAGLPGISGGDAAWGDYDNDGKPDILLLGHNGSTGITGIYRNNGDGTFTNIQVDMTHYFGYPPVGFELYNGSVAWGDYDNDGHLDALLTGCYTATCYQTSLDIYHNNGNGTFTLAFVGGGARYSSVKWSDYDNDGYSDILLTGSMGWAGYETCKTIIYHNHNGSGFTDIGALITGACQGSAAWGDYDNDGKLDIVIAGNSTPNGSAMAKVYRNDGNGEFTDIGASLKDIYYGSVAWGDYEGDSDLDILLTGEGSALVYRNGMTATNTTPAVPTGLHTSSCSALSCNLTWNASTDDHTPASGLTYNVRVGTTPGAGDVVSPMAVTSLSSTLAISNGYRLVPRIGNANENLRFELQGLNPETTYYWSAQAIDTAYAGSSFSTEASFTTGALSRIYLPSIIKQ